jgi:hypothetical protein
MPCQGFERRVCEHQQATHPNIISLCDLQQDSVSHSLFLESCLNGTSEVILPISVAPEMIEKNSGFQYRPSSIAFDC